MPIVDGIDTKGDEKTVLPTRFLELENVVFTSPGSLRKRYGYTALPNQDLSSNDITTGSALSSFRDELLLYSNSNLYSFSEGENKWEGKGEIKFCNSSSLQVSADNFILENPSSFTADGVTCYAYEQRLYSITQGTAGAPNIYDEYKNIQIIVVDEASNTILAKHTIDNVFMSGAANNSSYYAPKVGLAGSTFVVAFFAQDSDVFGGGIRFVSIDFLNPKVITLNSTKLLARASTAPATLKMDILTFKNKVFIAYTTSVLDTIIKAIDTTLAVSPAFSTGTNFALNNVSLSYEGPNIRILLSAANGSVAKAYLVNYALTVLVHPAVTLSAVVFPTVGNPLYDSNDGYYTITGVEDPNNSAQTIILVQIKNWNTKLGMLATLTINSSGVQTLISSTAHIGLELQSKAVAYDKFVYFFASKNVDPTYTASGIVAGSADPTKNDPEYQVNKPVRTLYLVKNLVTASSPYKTELTGQYDVDENVFVYSDYTTGLPNCNIIDDVITKPSAVITSLQPAGASRVLASTVIKKQVADFSQTSNYFDTAQGEALHISGGLLKMYDGYKVVEHGFLDTPEAPKDINPLVIGSGGDLRLNANSGVTGGGLRYLYCTVFKWTDRTGKIHRSSPSLPVSLTTPGTSSNKYDVTINFIPSYLSSKDNLEVEVYRTTGNGTIFYRLSKVVDAVSVVGTDDYITGSYPNAKNVKYIRIIDSVTDQELAYSEPLYTTGGVLENDSALSSSYVASYKARIFLILSDGYTLQYSKVTGIGQPVSFNAAFKIPLDDKGGKAIALAVMDDHLLIFKERAIFALTGEGPNELGQQDDYRTPYQVTADAGCVDPNSIVENPEGIMFKSAKGIYMIKRNFGLQYIGDSVEKYNSETIRSATLLSSVNQIRLITDSGRALVYDYYSNRWTTFTNIRGLDSIEFKGTYYYVKSSGLVYKETPGFFQDNGQFIKMRIKSAWIQISGVQGFQRFYKLLLLGTYKSAHNLLVKLGYDFNSSYQQQTIVTVADTISPTTYGQDTPYGSGTPYGGEYPLYQWLIFPKKQKCQSFQFELEDVKTTVDGESFNLSHVMAEVGIKEGGFPKETPKAFGTK